MGSLHLSGPNALYDLRTLNLNLLSRDITPEIYQVPVSYKPELA